MGWAKYTEDNIEICMDWQYMHGGWCTESNKRNSNSEGVIFEGISISVQHKSEYKPAAGGDYDEDKYLFCRECKKMFVFPVSSQRAYAAKGWVEPKRCKSCRKKRQAA